MYFKVYAQCCKAVKPVEQIAESELRDQIEVLIDQGIDTGLLQDADDIENAYEIAINHLEHTEILSCGDYCIVKQENVPQERPRMCGFDTNIFEN